MSVVKVLLFALLLLCIGLITGCPEEYSGKVDVTEINYSLYGPHEMDMNQ